MAMPTQVRALGSARSGRSMRRSSSFGLVKLMNCPHQENRFWRPASIIPCNLPCPACVSFTDGSKWAIHSTKRLKGYDIMKSNFDKWALFGGCFLLTASSILASPLQRSDVAADPAWLIHVDFDNLRSTALGQFALAEMEKPEVQAKFAVFQSLFSFDPRKQLHGVTLYSTGKVPTDGVLLLYADFDSSKLETLAQSAKDHQSTKHNQYVIHSWIDDKRHDRDGSKARTYGAIYGTRLVILAQEESRVTTALDVLDRTAPNLSTSASFADLDYGQGGSFFEAAARKLDVPGSEPHAAMLRLSKFARLQVAEKQHQLTATLNL